MIKAIYRLCERENYQRLTDRLIDLNSTMTIILGDTPTPVGRYYYFVLSNGAGVVSSRDDELVQLGVKNETHAKETKSLLSKLVNIPVNKFIRVN